MANTCKLLIYTSIILNVILALADRITQFVYCGITKFIEKTVGDTCLAFILIYPLANMIIIILYMLSQNDYQLTIKQRIFNFFYYLLSVEACYPMGVQNSTKNRYHLEADNILLTKKVINAMHILFVSIPQLLIVTIHSSSIGVFSAIDVASLLLSSTFIFWSIIYYVLCSVFEDDFFNELVDY
jgi:hypothetical protein